jgi:hypothetical protein
VPQAVQQRPRPLTVLHAGGRDRHRQEQAEGIDEDGPFAAVDVFGFVVAVDPPCSVVLTDWLSIIPALG